MQSIIAFLFSLVYSVVMAAELAHAGQDKAGQSKKAYAQKLIADLLAGSAPTIPGVSATIVSAVWSALGFIMPNVDETVIDWLVTKLNSLSFFTKIEDQLTAVFSLLNVGGTTTQAAQ